MSDIESANFSETAASNNAASPNGAPEGMAPSGVNDTIREIMGADKREWNRSHPTITSGGAANVQTLTYTIAPAAYVQGQRYSFVAGFSNSGATTLNVNGLGAVAVTKNGATALAGGEINAGAVVTVMYDGTQFQLTDGVLGALIDPATLTSTDASASAGPTLNLDRNSASPAANDILAILQFLGRNSTAATRTYAAVQAAILDATNASEDARLDLRTIVAGAIATRLSLGQGLFSANATGGDKGADTANFSNIYRNGGLIDRRVPAVHATGYTQVATDEFAELVANSGGAVAWTMMSGATFGAGGIQYVSCEGAGTILTLTRAGSDTFASGGATNLTTLVLNTGDRGYLVCDGGSPAIWRFHGTRHFDSGQQTITSGGALTIAHGLGVQPSVVDAWLHCVTGEANYSAGNEVPYNLGGYNDGTHFWGIAAVVDSTNIVSEYGNNTNAVALLNHTSGTLAFLTNANWKAIFRAFVFN